MPHVGLLYAEYMKQEKQWARKVFCIKTESMIVLLLIYKVNGSQQTFCLTCFERLLPLSAHKDWLLFLP